MKQARIQDFLKGAGGFSKDLSARAPVDVIK